MNVCTRYVHVFFEFVERLERKKERKKETTTERKKERKISR